MFAMIDPFLKWVGGKRWLVKAEKFPIPKSFNRYIEPFLGSGALFFHLSPKESILSDINSELIETYQVIRDDYCELEKMLKEHQNNHAKEYYYLIRSRYPDSKIARAARFIYLNRTCWNGLYRVNLKGQFNVPIGTRASVIRVTDNFENISRLLKKTKLFCLDFEQVIDGTRDGDFLFVDPPYTVKHNKNNFIKYNENIFKWKDQIRLKSCLSEASKRGVQIVMTNADHISIKDLYSDIGRYKKMPRRSCLAAEAMNRKVISEAVFYANF